MAPDRSCKATKDDGTPCGAPASVVDPETGLCPAHDPEREEERRAAARKGGKATARRFSGGNLEADELPPLTSAQAAERWCDVVGRAVVTGRLSHTAGQAALRAVREWRESRDKGQVSQRLEALLDALETWKDTGDPEPVLELVE